MNNTTGIMFKAVCNVLGYRMALVKHLLNTNPKVVDELNAASELLSDLDIAPEHFEGALDDWKISDWRGRKGERPTPIQFAEHCALWFENKARQQTVMEDLNKKQPWYVRNGISKNKLDKMLWEIEAARDPKWGKYCT